MGIEVLIILLLILANGVFAMSEIAIVSAKKNLLEQASAKGNAGAKIALKLANEPSEFLSTVQVGITLIGIIAGAYGGKNISEDVAEQLNHITWLAGYTQTISFIIVVGVITYLSLIIGELVPKRLALDHAERIAIVTAPIMLLLSRATKPIVLILTWSTTSILRVLGVKRSTESSVTEDEVNYLVNIGTKAGVFEVEEKNMVRRVLHLDTLPVSAVMTPRSEIIWFDTLKSTEENMRGIIAHGYSYFPVCKGSIDTVIGIAAIKNFLALQQKDTIDSIVSAPIITPMHTTVLDLLGLFKSSGKRIALVIDEYGGVRGLVSLGDILEAITGDIHSDDRQHDIEIVQRDETSWLIDASLPIHDFVTHFDLPDDFFKKRSNYSTLAGFMLNHYKEIPHIGAKFMYKGWQFEIVNSTGPKIDTVLVEKTTV